MPVKRSIAMTGRLKTESQRYSERQRINSAMILEIKQALGTPSFLTLTHISQKRGG